MACFPVTALTRTTVPLEIFLALVSNAALTWPNRAVPGL